MLKHGILGLLNYGDMTGYEIKEVFDNSLRFFWSAQTSQIYRELQNLNKCGFIEMTTVPQSGKPAKNVCHITESGRQELTKWLGESLPASAGNSPLLMKVFFMGNRPDEENVTFFEQLKCDCERGLESLQNVEEIIKSFSSMIDDPQRARYWQMTLDFGRQYMRTSIAWAEDCIKRLERDHEHTCD